MSQWISPSYIGSAFAIGGNLLVALSLNTQKLAHQRLAERKRKLDASDDKAQPKRRRRFDSGQSTASSQGTDSDVTIRPISSRDHRQEPPKPHLYTITENDQDSPAATTPGGRLQRKWLSIKRNQSDVPPQNRPTGDKHRNAPRKASPLVLCSAEVPRSASPDVRKMKGQHAMLKRTGSDSRNFSQSSPYPRNPEPASKGDGDPYLKSKIWWLGLALMALGELGNFTSYAFAPASVVAPLGTVALIANCFIAPVMLKEKFRKKDIIGITLSIAGAVIVVLSGKSQNRSLSPSEVLVAISQMAFIIYASIASGLIVILAVLSGTKAGDNYLAIDIFVVALSGGFTVLATKAFSSFLTRSLFDCFRDWITYVILLVLVVTAVVQVAFLNRALRRFEARVVVPSQFVSFTISAIVGSAILFRDFEDVELASVLTFFAGCALVFAGVVVLTRSQPRQQSDRHKTADKPRSRRSSSTQHTPRPVSEVTPLLPISITDRAVEVEVAGSATPIAIQPIEGDQPEVRKLRKYASIGTLPRAAATVVAPLRTGRSLTTRGAFSPGFYLIAGHLDNLSRDQLSRTSSEDEVGSGGTLTGSQSASEDSAQSTPREQSDAEDGPGDMSSAMQRRETV